MVQPSARSMSPASDPGGTVGQRVQAHVAVFERDAKRRQLGAEVGELRLPAQRGLGARPGQGEVALEPAGRLDDVLREQFQPGQLVGGEVDFAAERGAGIPARGQTRVDAAVAVERSEEHTSELQSLMRTSYAVF